VKPLNITHTTDPSGREVVGVRLSNAPDQTAWLYREDFERITAQYPGSWSLTHADRDKSPVRVKTGKEGRSVYVARIIAQAPEGSAIIYHDEDRLNLREGNLGLTRGCGGRARKRKAPVGPRKALRVPFTTRGGARV
jgi:hypothetical protein